MDYLSASIYEQFPPYSISKFWLRGTVLLPLAFSMLSITSFWVFMVCTTILCMPLFLISCWQWLLQTLLQLHSTDTFSLPVLSPVLSKCTLVGLSLITFSFLPELSGNTTATFPRLASPPRLASNSYPSRAQFNIPSSRVLLISTPRYVFNVLLKPFTSRFLKSGTSKLYLP